ncbi:MAG TPA: putative beta-lysine N-acetyltransferase [Desulfonatronum sp.]|nr:putative beta-lysine N-acetyltransferase [Desulfonatronum sp.]
MKLKSNSTSRHCRAPLTGAASLSRPIASRPTDTLEHIGNSLVQHGPLNKRAYLMHLAPQDEPDIVPRLEQLAREHGYTKIFAKVQETMAPRFTRSGFSTEAFVPGMFNGREGGAFLGRYFADWRKRPEDPQMLADVLETAHAKAATLSRPRLPRDAAIVRMTPDQTEHMAALYAAVFDSYPFPIFDPDYLRRSMATNVRYYGVLVHGRPVALASAEMDFTLAAAEMTDFATLPEYRGRKLAGALLEHMGRKMQQAGLCTLYTIARAASFGMNITFARAGYVFGGTLPNNTHIAGDLESMHVWYLSLRPEETT